jgi:hypothetical protein
MDRARLAVLFVIFVIGFLPPRAAAQGPEGVKPQAVLRISRSFLVKLTRRQFTQDEPIQTTAMGATVTGTAHAAGGYNVKLHPSSTESNFDLLVAGTITTEMTVTRPPVVLRLSGATPLEGFRRVRFDGRTFVGQPASVGACYHAQLDQLCTLRHGPASPFIRCVARPIVLRSLPDADAEADRDIRGQVGDSITQETDRIIAVLNDVVDVQRHAVEFLRAYVKLPPVMPPAVAATDEYLLAGVGFAPGEPPHLPQAAGPAQAPVELWVHHKLTLTQEVLVKLLDERLKARWKQVKPAIKKRLEKHSPELAQLIDDVREDVTLEAVKGEPNWHVIRFSRQLHAAPDR